MIKKVNEILSPVYMVGGSVRDYLLGLQPKDYDFSTPYTPDEIEKAIKESGRKAYLVGARFGTIGCKIDGELVEITTFRNEKYQEGNRKPEVSFVKNIEDDLSRRDFTINAIAMDSNKTLIDPFNGQEDLKLQILACVGKPSERFKEDPLRLLRLCRFVGQFGFAIEQDTFDQAKQLSYKILEVSKERWCIELDKLLMSNFVVDGLLQLANIKLLNYMLPELALQVGFNQQNPFHSKLLFDHTIEVVKNSQKDINIRWAALLHDIAKPFVKNKKADNHYNYHKHDYLGKEIVTKYALYLKWSNDRRKIVEDLVLNHMEESSPLREADKKSH